MQFKPLVSFFNHTTPNTPTTQIKYTGHSIIKAAVKTRQTIYLHLSFFLGTSLVCITMSMCFILVQVLTMVTWFGVVYSVSSSHCSVVKPEV